MDTKIKSIILSAGIAFTGGAVNLLDRGQILLAIGVGAIGVALTGLAVYLLEKQIVAKTKRSRSKER